MGDTIVPVVNINPKDYREVNFVIQGGQSTTGSITALITDSVATTFLTGYQISYWKDVTADNTNVQLLTTLNGVANSVLFYSRSPSVTAKDFYASRELTVPIKLDKGVTVLLTGSFTVGAMVRTIVLYGYTVEAFEAL